MAKLFKEPKTLEEYIDYNLGVMKKAFQRQAKGLLELGASPELITKTRIDMFTEVGMKDFGLPEDKAHAIAAAALAKYDHIPK